MTNLPPLTWIRTFEAAARLASFSAAADELALTQPAVSQHVRQLEAKLDRQLFRRLLHGVELTADGAAYLPHVQAALGGLTRATRDLFGADEPASVTIATPASILALWPTCALRTPGSHSSWPRSTAQWTTMAWTPRSRFDSARANGRAEARCR